ncbi:MAG TPA: ABATE domain-containing protein [Solirubrobacteraceae bacterium]|nr:ABATE domain-containing protein [Solirubrobacteraceae bacterium]
MVTKTAADLELAGGNLALDLVNTRDGHAPATDYLERPDDLVLWARHAAGLEIDGAVLAEVLELRETVDAVFRAVARGGAPPPGALADLMAAQAAHPGRLVRAGDRFELTWDRDIVGPLASAAVDLLRGDQLDRLQVCEACPWLFLDLSRNRSRRWCSMNVCGGTLKMRRYRARKRATERRRPGTGSSA